MSPFIYTLASVPGGFPSPWLAASSAGAGSGRPWSQPHIPTRWPDALDLLSWCQSMGPGEAALLILAGIVYLLWGLGIYKYLVTINAAVVGMFLGAIVGQHVGSTLAGALVGGFTAAAVTWPLMKWAVAMMGGLFGAIVGASVWRVCGQPPEMAWAGALTGMVLFGLMAFILFRNCIIVYMSLQGATMLMLGLMGLACKYPDFPDRVGRLLKSQPLLVPTAVFIPMVIGLIFQHTSLKPAKPPGGGGSSPPPPAKK